MFIEPNLAKKMEKAITFLVERINESGKNPKPVIIHSIQVGLTLAKYNYSEDITIAGILHDLVEDSDTTLQDIEERFGSKVRELVDAHTFDDSIQDPVERYKTAFNRSAKIGKDALVMVASDMINNRKYYHLSPPEKREWLNRKYETFIQIARPALNNEPIWQELTENKE